MKTYAHLWHYFAEFFSEWEIFHTKFAGKIKIHILCSITFSRKSCRLWENVEKYGRAGEAASSYAFWIAQATDTHSEHVVLFSFPRQEWLPECASMLRLYVYFNINITLTPTYSKWSVAVTYIHQNPTLPSLQHALPISSSFFDNPNNACEEQKSSWNSSLFRFLQFPVTSFLLGPNIFLSTQCLETLSLFFL